MGEKGRIKGVKKMKVSITMRALNRGVRFGREFQACARLLKGGRGGGGERGKRQDGVCSKAHSPRAALQSVLRKTADRLAGSQRKGHKRFGRGK